MKTPVVFPPCTQGSGSNQEPAEVDLSALKTGAYMLWKGKQGRLYRVPRDMKSLRIPDE